MGKRKRRKLLNAEQAKAMLAEAGEEFETPARKLIKDDFAQLRTMFEFTQGTACSHAGASRR